MTKLIERMMTDIAFSARIRRSDESFGKQTAVAAWAVALGGMPKAEPVAAVATVRHAA